MMQEDLPYQSFSQTQIALGTALISILIYKLVKKLTSNDARPPRVWGFPIVGYIPFLGKEPNVTFMKLKERFGDIFQIQMGSWTAVVVNGKQAIREALKNRGDDFSGRPQSVSSKILHDGENLSLGQFNEDWKIHHKLAAKVINEFFSSKKHPIETVIHEEIQNLLHNFTSHGGKSFDPHRYIYMSVSSVIYQICYGRQKNIRESKDFLTYIQNASEFNSFVSAGNPMDFLPWLQYITPWKLKKFSYLITTASAFRSRRVEEHRLDFSPEHIRDLTDALLAVSKEETRLTGKRILQTIDAFFGAGTETLTAALRWAVLLLAAHPDVQKRVQTEIDDTVGDGRLPEIKDRGRLVYTEAVLHEINRFTALEPLGLPHLTTKDTELGGFTIMRNTVVFINLYSMSHDKSVWGDPHVFRPERFLDESGQVKKSLLEEFLPFSAGRRACMGKSLATTEMFLFLTGLLQRCSVLQPADTETYNMHPEVGLTRECLPYNVHAELRN